MKNLVSILGIVFFLYSCNKETPQGVCYRFLKYAKAGKIDRMKEMIFYNDSLYKASYIDSSAQVLCQDMKKIELPDRENIILTNSDEEIYTYEYSKKSDFIIALFVIKRRNLYKICYINSFIFSKKELPDSILNIKMPAMSE